MFCKFAFFLSCSLWWWKKQGKEILQLRKCGKSSQIEELWAKLSEIEEIWTKCPEIEEIRINIPKIPKEI